VRDDTQQVLGVVKKRYRILQNDSGPQLLDELVAAGDALYETAGSLHGGSQVWWLLKLPEETALSGDLREQLQTSILLCNSHDGSIATTITTIVLRKINQTTLTWPLPNTPFTNRTKHCNTSTTRTLAAHEALNRANNYTSELRTAAEQMLERKINDGQFTAFLNQLVPTPRAKITNDRALNQRGITMADNTKGQITQIYHHNPTQTHVHGTLWGALQAVQYYSDHLATNRNTDDASADENRFKRLTSGKTLGSQAFAQALALVEGK